MPTNKMGQALLDPESLTEPKQKRNFSGRPIPEYNSQGPSRPASVLGNYAVAPDDFSTQKITVDDDLEFTASGRLETQWGRQLHTLLLILTLGLYHLACRWFVHVEINIKTKSCALKSASHVVIVNQANELGYERVMTLDFNGLASSVFTVPACEQDFKMSRLYCFEYRYFRFILNPFTGSFEPNYAWSDPLLETVEALLNGSRVLSEAQIEERTAIFGSNEMEIREKSTLGLLFDEVLHPFFVFQIVSIVLWCLDHYYYYATCIFIISALSAGSTLMETKNNIFQMRSLSKLSCQVRIWRNRCWSYGKSEDMVPGDIFELESGLITVLPCDAVLLEGDCIVNESMLTGESLPVSKTPIPNTALQTMDFAAEEPASSPRMALYFLFSGTRIIRVRPYIPSTGNAEFTPSSSKRGAIALVVRTGFNTAKGNLVRNMLFPRPNNFKFYQDSFRFVAVLAMISGIGFLGSVYNFISLGVDWQTILLRALDLITIAVPPALPATMAIGTSFAIVRLRKGEIFCTSPSIVNICGKLNIMCFDKTGTLTEEGLDVLGIRFTVPSESRIEDAFGELKPGVLQRFSRLYRNVFDVLPKPFTIPSANSNIDVAYSASLRGPAIATSMASIFVSKEPTNPTAELDFPYPLIVCAMAACHSIKVVHGQHVGDPLDLKMFEFTGWFLEEDNVSYTRKPARIMAVRPPWVPSYDAVSAVGHISDDETYTELEVIKLYEFVSQLRRMSVISRRHCYPTTFEEPGFRNWDILCKGAPEAMRAICVPETLPPDYEDQLRYYTHHGYRVLAVAWKRMEPISPSYLTKLPREKVECGLAFLGFIIFENKLKSGTARVIDTLNKANIRQVMCTGDNLLTAISVSRECNLVNDDDTIYVPRFASGQSHEKDAVIEWVDVDETGQMLDPRTFQQLPTSRLHDRRPSSLRGGFQLAITGDVFQWMVDFAPDAVFERMLVKCQIYTRMSPDLKHFLVDNLQCIGYCVGFCGDGTNDCGALKTADAGLSLSEAEASVAAPFTSKQTDLDCVLRLIREGRAALVTSFCCFKYMALYSLIQFSSVSILYSLGQNISDFQFMYIDLVLIIPIAIFMGQTGPHPSIHHKRPTARLVSKKVLSSMIGQFIIQLIIQLFAFYWVRRQAWYLPGVVDLENEVYLTFENTIVFLVSCYQYLIVAVVFTVGPPYQAEMWKNVPYLIALCTLALITIHITFNPAEFILDILALVEIPSDGRVFLLMLAAFNLVTSWTAENYIFPYVAKAIGNASAYLSYDGLLSGYDHLSVARQAKIRKWQQSGKRFKIVQDEFRY